jgi:hypothetical protein
VTAQKTTGVPARGYSWEPFQPGNQVGLRHGAWSPRRTSPLATELVELVLADPALTYLHAPQWRPALWSWATSEAQTQLLEIYLARLAEEAGDDSGVGDLGDE